MNIQIRIIITIILLTLSALFSGLTLGLMSLKISEIRRKAKLGDKKAEKIYKLRKKGNQLLITLLLGNVGVNVGISLLLGSLMSGIIAGITATTLIVIFGEITPQVLFHHYAITLGSYTSFIIWPFYYILYPITMPLSKIIDKTIGKEKTKYYPINEMKLLIKEHHSAKGYPKNILSIIQSSLELQDKKVKDVMTRRLNTFFLSSKALIDRKTLKKIKRKGKSRVPVYNIKENKVEGILYTKDLITINPNDKIPVTQIMRNEVKKVKENDKLTRVLKEFLKTKTHLFIVEDENNEMKGIITLEDVIEEIIGEIEDEYDQKVLKIN